MDNGPGGATPVRFIMAQAPSSRVPTSDQYVQLPSMQQLVSPNGKQTVMHPMLSPPQAENQTLVQLPSMQQLISQTAQLPSMQQLISQTAQLPSMQQLISQTAKPVQLQQVISPQGESQTVVQQSAAVGPQPMMPGQMGMPSFISKYM